MDRLLRFRVGSVFFLLLALFLAACQPPPGAHEMIRVPGAQGLGNNGNPGNGKQPPPAILTYTDVEPIFQSRCSACHFAGNPYGVPNWMDPQTAHNYASMILQMAVNSTAMPLPGSPQAGAITKQDRAELGKWISEGAQL